MKNIRLFTAFSGYDSQCMALEKLCEECADISYDLIGWSEIDPKAIVSHNLAFPQYADRLYGDICSIDWNSVPDFDLFTYSSPCQSFSMAGKREGGEKGSGTASSLLWECQKAIYIKRPRICIFENVKGLVDKTMYHTFQDWQHTMGTMNYRNYWQVMNAADYGVPQHRERVIMVSIQMDNLDKLPEYSFPEPINREKQPEDLLEEDIQSHYYFSEEECTALVDLFKNDYAGFKRQTNFRSLKKTKPEGGTCIKRFVTPTCKDGSISTLMANSTGAATNMFSISNRPYTGVLEIRKKVTKEIIDYENS